MLDRLKLLRYPRNRGYCPICERSTLFVETRSWLRDHYLCWRCRSIPRQRALASALERFRPAWRDESLHESSPAGPISDFLGRNAGSYSSSHYFEDVPRGETRDGHRSEDLSRMTFEEESFDVFVTLDVFEHVMEPAPAFREIARVLKPGGMHVFTMPWYPELASTVQRAAVEDGRVVHLQEPVYHGNPIDDGGSLVTFDWGLDFPAFIAESSGMATVAYRQRDRSLGLDGEFLEVFVSRKAARAEE